jgi:Holliday junction resolvase RusA-like endonuclease
MILEFFIPGELTTANDFIAATNRSRWDGAEVKKTETQRAKLACRELPTIQKYPVRIHMTWYRADRRSDPDNVAFAIKFILDGLQKAGVLRQDTWACIKSIHHEFELDPKNPGVSVSISEAE